MDEKDKPEGTEPPENKDKDPLGEAGKKALDAERKARREAEAAAKAARDELAQLKAAADTSKSDIERLTEKLAGLETRAQEAELKALRSEVAQVHNLPPALARRLTGTSREEMEADAEELSELVGKKKDAGAKPEDEKDDEGATPFSARPKEDLKAGASNPDDAQPDSKKLADEILSSGW